jgi:hypothetical protein
MPVSIGDERTRADIIAYLQSTNAAQRKTGAATGR